MQGSHTTDNDLNADDPGFAVGRVIQDFLVSTVEASGLDLR